MSGAASQGPLLSGESFRLKRMNAVRLVASASSGVALALLRMHRFAVLYARELFVQFLSVTDEKAVDWEPEK
jgi:hypothetical protein